MSVTLSDPNKPDLPTHSAADEALPPSEVAGTNIVEFTELFYLAAALRLGRRPISARERARLIARVERVAASGDAAAAVVLDWVTQPTTGEGAE